MEKLLALRQGGDARDRHNKGLKSPLDGPNVEPESLSLPQPPALEEQHALACNRSVKVVYSLQKICRQLRLDTDANSSESKLLDIIDDGIKVLLQGNPHALSSCTTRILKGTVVVAQTRNINGGSDSGSCSTSDLTVQQQSILSGIEDALFQVSLGKCLSLNLSDHRLDF